VKYYPSISGYFAHGESTERNLRLLFKFLLILVILMIGYSIGFHFLMAFEERDYSWITGIYWTPTVMTTLGFSDIPFHSDLGRASLAVATHRDEITTNIAFTVRERPLRSLTHKAGFATVPIGKRKFLFAQHQLSLGGSCEFVRQEG